MQKSIANPLQDLCSSAVHCSGAGGLAECCRYWCGEVLPTRSCQFSFLTPLLREVSGMGMVSRQWLPAGKPHCTPSTVQTRLLAGPAQAPGRFPGSSLTLFQEDKGYSELGKVCSFLTWAEKSISFGSSNLFPSSVFKKSSKLPADREWCQS